MNAHDQVETAALRALRISEAIRPTLADLPLGMQGAILADLVSMFVSMHPEAKRDWAVERLIDLVTQLVAINDEERKKERPQ